MDYYSQVYTENKIPIKLKIFFLSIILHILNKEFRSIFPAVVKSNNSGIDLATLFDKRDRFLDRSIDTY